MAEVEDVLAYWFDDIPMQFKGKKKMRLARLLPAPRVLLLTRVLPQRVPRRSLATGTASTERSRRRMAS